MGKYLKIQDDIYSIFSSVEWQNENIKTIPSNGVADSGEFVRITILSNGEALNKNSASGILMAEIFTSAGGGPTRSVNIADKLDQYLAGKSINTVTGKQTQLFSSNFTFDGIDRDNPGLVKSTFSVQFKYFGVI
jgi:hypothetical protein